MLTVEQQYLFESDNIYQLVTSFNLSKEQIDILTNTSNKYIEKIHPIFKINHKTVGHILFDKSVFGDLNKLIYIFESLYNDNEPIKLDWSILFVLISTNNHKYIDEKNIIKFLKYIDFKSHLKISKSIYVNYYLKRLIKNRKPEYYREYPVSEQETI